MASLYFLDSFVEYAKNGLKRIHVKFYIEGSEPGREGTVHAEVEEVGPSRVVGYVGTWVHGSDHSAAEALGRVITCTCFSEPTEWPI